MASKRKSQTKSSKTKRSKAKRSRKQTSVEDGPIVEGGVIVPAIAKAFSHEARAEIVRALRGRDELSASDYAEESGVELSTASYHFSILRTLGMLALERTKQVRGAVESYYRLSDRAERALVMFRTAES